MSVTRLSDLITVNLVHRYVGEPNNTMTATIHRSYNISFDAATLDKPWIGGHADGEGRVVRAETMEQLLVTLSSELVEKLPSPYLILARKPRDRENDFILVDRGIGYSVQGRYVVATVNETSLKGHERFWGHYFNERFQAQKYFNEIGNL